MAPEAASGGRSPPSPLGGRRLLMDSRFGVPLLCPPRPRSAGHGSATAGASRVSAGRQGDPGLGRAQVRNEWVRSLLSKNTKTRARTGGLAGGAVKRAGAATTQQQFLTESHRDSPENPAIPRLGLHPKELRAGRRSRAQPGSRRPKGGAAKCPGGLPQRLSGEEPICNARAAGSIPGSGRPPGEETATCSSILAWRILSTEEPGGLQSIGQQGQTRLKGLSTHVTTDG